MQESQIVFRLLRPAYQQAAKPVHPAMRTFDYPAASAKAGFLFQLLRLFPSGADMRRKIEGGDGGTDFVENYDV